MRQRFAEGLFKTHGRHISQPKLQGFEELKIQLWENDQSVTGRK